MLLIFDLDGTLIDSREDLAISTNATRAYIGMEPLPADLIQSYVGDGAASLVRRALGPHFSEDQHSDALSFFLRYYRDHSLENTKLYHGVGDAVKALAQGTDALAVLTNKPLRISADILEALGIGSYFFRIFGGNSFPQKKPDPIGITTLMAEAQTGSAQTWMIGDSGVDIQTARNAGVRACGVNWGFKPEDFAAVPPDLVVMHPSEWLSLPAYSPS